LKNFARKLKNLAEDWAPVGVALPEILTQNPPIRLEEEGSAPLNIKGGKEVLKRKAVT